MKKAMMMVMMTALIAGCGSNQSETKYEGVVEERGKDYVAQGMKHLQDADVPKAIASFDRAIQQDPSNPENYLVLGQVYLRLNNVPRAVDSFTAATRVDPNNGEAFYLLATGKAMRKEIPEAIAAAKRSAEIFMKEKDEEKFKQAAGLLKSLTDAVEEMQKQQANGVPAQS